MLLKFPAGALHTHSLNSAPIDQMPEAPLSPYIHRGPPRLPVCQPSPPHMAPSLLLASPGLLETPAWGAGHAHQRHRAALFGTSLPGSSWLFLGWVHPLMPAQSQAGGCSSSLWPEPAVAPHCPRTFFSTARLGLFHALCPRTCSVQAEGPVLSSLFLGPLLNSWHYLPAPPTPSRPLALFCAHCWDRWSHFSTRSSGSPGPAELLPGSCHPWSSPGAEVHAC